MSYMLSKSYAKINLFLYVTGTREDGYHNIFSLFSKLNFYDVIKIERDKKFQICCNIKMIPTDKRNFIFKVYQILKKEYGLDLNIKVTLFKNIPIEAGLGGGSSNCAIFLKMINEYFNLNMSKSEMINVLKRVSADAPIFLFDKAVVAKGIGDEILYEVDLPKCYVLLVKPQFGVSTKDAYSSKNLKLTTKPHITNIHSLSNLNELSKLMYNSLETAVFKDYKELYFIKNTMENLGALKSLMSGSGSTIFGLFDSKNQLNNAYNFFKKISNKRYFVLKTNIL